MERITQKMLKSRFDTLMGGLGLHTSSPRGTSTFYAHPFMSLSYAPTYGGSRIEVVLPGTSQSDAISLQNLSASEMWAQLAGIGACGKGFAEQMERRFPGVSTGVKSNPARRNPSSGAKQRARKVREFGYGRWVLRGLDTEAEDAREGVKTAKNAMQRRIRLQDHAHALAKAAVYSRPRLPNPSRPVGHKAKCKCCVCAHRSK